MSLKDMLFPQPPCDFARSLFSRVDHSFFACFKGVIARLSFPNHSNTANISKKTWGQAKKIRVSKKNKPWGHTKPWGHKPWGQQTLQQTLGSGVVFGFSLAKPWGHAKPWGQVQTLGSKPWGHKTLGSKTLGSGVVFSFSLARNQNPHLTLGLFVTLGLFAPAVRRFS
jgi:hypothetical protein